MPSGQIHILGEPTYRLMQRFTRHVVDIQNAAAGNNPNMNWQAVTLLQANTGGSGGFQATQALRIVSLMCKFSCTGTTAFNDLVLTSAQCLLFDATATAILRAYPLAWNPPGIDFNGPCIAFKDDEYVLASDEAEFNTLAGHQISLLTNAGMQNNAAAVRAVAITLDVTYEIYQRELLTARSPIIRESQVQGVPPNLLR